MALELAYVANAKFDPLTSALRRGRAYEDAGKLAEAAAEYEKALILPYSPPDLPDEDEETVENQMMSQRAMPRQFDGRAPIASEVAVQRDLLARLQRLYSGLGKSERATELALRALELSDNAAMNADTLEQANVVTHGRSPMGGILGGKRGRRKANQPKIHPECG